jgi:hypothetical protein
VFGATSTLRDEGRCGLDRELAALADEGDNFCTLARLSFVNLPMSERLRSNTLPPAAGKGRQRALKLRTARA